MQDSGHAASVQEVIKGAKVKRLQTMHSAGPRALAADRSVYALWPLAAGCHTIDYYYY